MNEKALSAFWQGIRPAHGGGAWDRLTDKEQDYFTAWIMSDYVQAGLCNTRGYAGKLHFLFIVYESYLHGLGYHGQSSWRKQEEEDPLPYV